MSFLQPGILLGLPLLALPIIIHLVNRQRHRTVNWAAMRFLLDARRMSTGMARIRQWLILLMRMLIIAGIVTAISRPLAGLWMGGLADRAIRRPTSCWIALPAWSNKSPKAASLSEPRH